MGDVRFQRLYERVKDAHDRVALIREMSEEDLVAALAGASREPDPLVANVLATEAQNRIMRNRAMLENLGEGLVAETPIGVISYVNAETERLLGWSRDELIGQDFHKLCHVADRKAPHSKCPILRAAVSGEVMHLYKEVFQTRDGRRFWSSVTVAPLRSGDGEVDGLICVFHDTTREREQQADVERAKNLMLAVNRAEDALGQGSLVIEREEVVHANKAFLDMSGYTLEDLRALPSYLDLLHASFAKDALRRLLQSEAGMSVPAHDEGRLLRKDGREVPVHVSIVKVAPEENEELFEGPSARLVVIVRDMTAQKQAQEEVTRLVENLPDGVYVTDDAGTITFANAEAERILGLERSRMAGRRYNDNLWAASRPDGTPLQEGMLPAARALQGERVYDLPLSIIHAKTKERMRLRVSAAPMRDADGNLTGSVVSFRESRGPTTTPGPDSARYEHGKR